jgi:hypothetical protein
MSSIIDRIVRQYPMMYRFPLRRDFRIARAFFVISEVRGCIVRKYNPIAGIVIVLLAMGVMELSACTNTVQTSSLPDAGKTSQSVENTPSTGSSSDIAGNNSAKTDPPVNTPSAGAQEKARMAAATFFPDKTTVEFPAQGYTVVMDGVYFCESGTVEYVNSYHKNAESTYRLWYDVEGSIIGLEADGNQMFWKGTN